MALVEYMRSKERIPEIGSNKHREPGSQNEKAADAEEVPAEANEEEKKEEEKTNDVVSPPGFKNIRLSADETNIVYLELAEFLLEKSLSNLSAQCLEYVTDKNSVRVLFCIIKSKMLQQKYSEAAVDLESLFTDVDPTLTEAYILFGHCKFLLGQDEYENAKNAYYKAIRVANLLGSELKDGLLHQRIGSILIQQKKWDDSKVMFEMCASNYDTAFSFMNLGVSCLYLKEYTNAEKVL